MTLSRREFCSTVGAVGFAMMSGGRAVANDTLKPLRVIAYNVYGCDGWPQDRALAKSVVAKGQMPQRLANELALYEPDIVVFSESPPADVVKEVARRLGMNYVLFPSGGSWPGTLLTRFEIVESKNVPFLAGERPVDLFTRHWGRGVIKLPGGDELIVHSAHLMPGEDPVVRIREVTAMLKSMQKDMDANRSMLLLGDLNHGPDTAEYSLWTDAGWVDTFARVGAGKGLTIKADDPQWRIDYVMAAGPIAGQVVESRPLFEGAFRLNNADPRSFALSDHLPQFASFDLGK